MAIPISELQSLNPSSLIELFTLQLVEGTHYATGNPDSVPTIFRFHAGTSMNSNANIIWQGDTYQKFPIDAQGFEFSGKGQIPRPQLTQFWSNACLQLPSCNIENSETPRPQLTQLWSKVCLQLLANI